MSVAADTSPMNTAERALLDELLQGEQARVLLRSATRIDTGRWLRSSRLWLCVTEQSLLLFAASRRRHAERLAVGETLDTWYSHATGQLVIEPGEKLTINTISLKPMDARQVLDCIEQASQTHGSRASAAEPTKESHA